MIKRLIIMLWLVCLISPVNAQNLTLSDAIQRALDNNYGIVLAEYDTEIAGIKNSWGQAGRYPAIAIDAATTNSMGLATNPVSGLNRLSAGIGLNWTLFDGFKVKLTKKKLEQLEELTDGRSAVIIENTIQDVIEAYYYALLQQEQKKVYQKVTELSKDRFEAEERLKELGASVTYEVLQAKNLFLNDKYELLNQEILIKTTLRNLNYLMGEGLEQEWVLSDPFEHHPEDFVSEDLLAKMQSSNQALINQYINLEISHNEKKLANSAFMPSVSLSTGLDNSFANNFALQNGNTTTTAVAPYANLSLRYNLYTGGSRARAREIADINEKIAQVEVKDMKHAVGNQVLNEYDAYQVRKMQLQVATENLEAAEINLGIAAEKLRTGAINSFNYRDIQLTYLNTAIQKLQAIYALIRSHTNLTRLTGGFIQEN